MSYGYPDYGRTSLDYPRIIFYDGFEHYPLQWYIDAAGGIARSWEYAYKEEASLWFTTPVGAPFRAQARKGFAVPKSKIISVEMMFLLPEVLDYTFEIVLYLDTPLWQRIVHIRFDDAVPEWQYSVNGAVWLSIPGAQIVLIHTGTQQDWHRVKFLVDFPNEVIRYLEVDGETINMNIPNSVQNGPGTGLQGYLQIAADGDTSGNEYLFVDEIKVKEEKMV